ncbi:unnamed protein product, partial [Prunus brigantina]
MHIAPAPLQLLPPSVLRGPHSRLEPTVWQACEWHKVGVATTG